ncbi:MAG TPA: carbon-nitrogen hydrolase family protein, partial [Bacillota bacterium]|nr:carbon-nitrogen hydrolase family protein [Bacillota bacterium]
MEIRLGICQFKVGCDKTFNLIKAEQAINQAVDEGAQMVVLPEMFNCPYQQEFFSQFAETAPGGETLIRLAELAETNKCYIVGGSIPEQAEGNLYNTCFIFDRTGQIIARHRKIHLFDIEIPGKVSFKESAVLKAGQELTWFDTEFGRFGVVICYDLRFPELFRLMADAGVQGVLIPAAFNLTTGPAHWETLMRARAIDNQVYIIGVGPASDSSAQYVAYGHSVVVDPWGTVLWEADES